MQPTALKADFISQSRQVRISVSNVLNNVITILHLNRYLILYVISLVIYFVLHFTYIYSARI